MHSTPGPLADPDTDLVPAGALDPATFEGTLVVAVPSGAEVVVNVKAGQAETVAAEIRAADSDGTLSASPRSPRAVGCGVQVRSVAYPTGYATSVKGCAVMGYPGYKREYKWEVTSDVNICTKGRGFASNNAATWFSTGCGGGSYSVPWGNVLAYTQMQGLSMSGLTGATYVWRA
jgi:hypothetical protein